MSEVTHRAVVHDETDTLDEPDTNICGTVNIALYYKPNQRLEREVCEAVEEEIKRFYKPVLEQFPDLKVILLDTRFEKAKSLDDYGSYIDYSLEAVDPEYNIKSVEFLKSVRHTLE